MRIEGGRVRWGLIGFIAVAALAVGCARQAPTPGPASAPASGSTYTPDPPLSPPVVVKAGFLRSASDAPMVIAQQRGYFKAEGLDVQFEEFTITSDALPALGTGQIDVMAGGINPALFNAAARGVNVQVVADAGSVAPGNDWMGLVVRKDLLESGRYKSPADLKGMKVGLPGNYIIVHYMLKRLLEQNGLTLKDVETTVTAGGPNTVAAIANKAVDVVVNIEPFLSEPERQGTGTVVLRATQVDPSLVGALLLMSPDLQGKQPQAAQRYLVAWMRGVRDYVDAFTANVDREAVVKLLGENGVAIAAGVQVPALNPDGSFAIKGVQDVLQWYRDEKQVEVPVDLDRLVSFELTNKAVQRLGPYQPRRGAP